MASRYYRSHRPRALQGYRRCRDADYSHPSRAGHRDGGFRDAVSVLVPRLVSVRAARASHRPLVVLTTLSAQPFESPDQPEFILPARLYPAGFIFSATRFDLNIRSR